MFFIEISGGWIRTRVLLNRKQLYSTDWASTIHLPNHCLPDTHFILKQIHLTFLL